MFIKVILLGAALIFFGASSQPVAAQAFGGSFEAKRIKPPSPGTKKRINVQIELRDNPAVPPPPVRPKPTEPQVASADPETETRRIGDYAWFWDRMSPQLLASGPGRLDQALQVLRGAASPVSTPRLQHLQKIAQTHGVDILASTIGTQVSPALVLAMISIESSGRVDAVSSAGAAGLMQLMPDTALRFGVTDRTIAAENIAGGVRYLDWLMKEFQRDPLLVLAGYNAGEGAVRKHDGVPPYSETRDYVPKVLAAFEVAKGLCLTPPELISDGCVFVKMN